MFNTNIKFNQKLMNMKKVIYLVVLMVALATVFVSCEKDNGDDPIVPETPALITVADLAGDWDFVSITVDGTTYTDPCNSIVVDMYDAGTFMYFHNVAPTGTFVLGGGCSGWEGGDELAITNTNGKYILSYANDNYQYEIMNAGTVKTDGELKLKLTYSAMNNYPIGAIYILAK
jgi:hypothetical protein